MSITTSDIISSHARSSKSCKAHSESVSSLPPSPQTWKKFGDAAEDNPKGPDQATTVRADEVYLTLTTNKEVQYSLAVYTLQCVICNPALVLYLVTEQCASSCSSAKYTCGVIVLL